MPGLIVPVFLAQVLKWSARSPIEALDQVHGTGRRRRGLSRWRPFGALGFAQLAGRHRLRDVAYSLASQANALAPLGLRPPKRSTLAEANARRLMALYPALLAMRYTQRRAVAPFNTPLFSLDSTTSSLCLSWGPWARFRTTTGAITVHALLDQAGHVPAVVVRTEGKRRELTVARGLHLPGDNIVTRARGDSDYQLLCRLHPPGVDCVTRQQVTAQVGVPARFTVDRCTGVTADREIVLTGANGRAFPALLR